MASCNFARLFTPIIEGLIYASPKWQCFPTSCLLSQFQSNFVGWRVTLGLSIRLHYDMSTIVVLREYPATAVTYATCCFEAPYQIGAHLASADSRCETRKPAKLSLSSTPPLIPSVSYIPRKAAQKPLGNPQFIFLHLFRQPYFPSSPIIHTIVPNQTTQHGIAPLPPHPHSLLITLPLQTQSPQPPHNPIPRTTTQQPTPNLRPQKQNWVQNPSSAAPIRKHPHHP